MSGEEVTRVEDRAREAALRRRAERAAAPKVASEFQETAAYELKRITGCEVAPLSVEEREARVGYTEIDGHRFRFRALWKGSDWRYGTNWTDVEVRRGLLRRRRWVEVRSLADLGEVLCQPAPTPPQERKTSDEQ